MGWCSEPIFLVHVQPSAGSSRHALPHQREQPADHSPRFTPRWPDDPVWSPQRRKKHLSPLCLREQASSGAASAALSLQILHSLIHSMYVLMLNSMCLGVCHSPGLTSTPNTAESAPLHPPSNQTREQRCMKSSRAESSAERIVTSARENHFHVPLASVPPRPPAI